MIWLMHKKIYIYSNNVMHKETDKTILFPSLYIHVISHLKLGDTYISSPISYATKHIYIFM